MFKLRSVFPAISMYATELAEGKKWYFTVNKSVGVTTCADYLCFRLLGCYVAVFLIITPHIGRFCACWASGGSALFTGAS